MASAAELLALRWNANLRRDKDGAPLLPPLFVLGQGAGVALVDLRPADEATGALGYIPGSVFVGGSVAGSAFAPDRPLVFVSRSGVAAARVARRLEQEGRQQVAAMAGGLIEWRTLGLVTSREVSGVRRQPHQPSPATNADGISKQWVERHVGDSRNVRWIKLGALLTSVHCSCIDGRDDRGVVGTLGGDAGEFLLSLAALEQGAGVVLDEQTVERMLIAHIDAYGQFYMHSDVDAFGRLRASIEEDARIDVANLNWSDAEGVAAFLRQPDPAIRDALLEHLVQPDHIGCGHLRLMLQHSAEYGVRPELVTWFLRAYFRRWWEGAPELAPTLLPGDHEEAAVINIRIEGTLCGPTPIPLVSPASDGRQMFINHPDVSAFLRASFIRFHLSGYGALVVPADREEGLRQAYAELGQRQLVATVSHLAAGLPVYDGVFSHDGSFTVRDA